MTERADRLLIDFPGGKNIYTEENADEGKRIRPYGTQLLTIDEMPEKTDEKAHANARTRWTAQKYCVNMLLKSNVARRSPTPVASRINLPRY